MIPTESAWELTEVCLHLSCSFSTILYLQYCYCWIIGSSIGTLIISQLISFSLNQLFFIDPQVSQDLCTARVEKCNDVEQGLKGIRAHTKENPKRAALVKCGICKGACCRLSMPFESPSAPFSGLFQILSRAVQHAHFFLGSLLMIYLVIAAMRPHISRAVIVILFVLVQFGLLRPAVSRRYHYLF